MVEALADGGSCGDEDEEGDAWWEVETTAETMRSDAVVAATAAAARESARGSALSTACVDGTDSGMAAKSAYRAVRRTGLNGERMVLAGVRWSGGSDAPAGSEW